VAQIERTDVTASSFLVTGPPAVTGGVGVRRADRKKVN
jgi:hypothetical protein